MLRNFLTLSTGEAAARGLHAVAILLLVRRLKPEQFGIFELALSITAYAVLAVQQGFDTIAIRGVAAEPEAGRAWLRRVLGLRLRFALPVAALMAGAGVWRRDEALGLMLMVLSGAALAGALTPRFLLLGLERARPAALAAATAQVVFLLAVALLVRTPADAPWAAAAWVAGETAAALLLWLHLRGLWSAPASDAAPCHLLRESWPVTVTLLLGQLTYNFDTLALGLYGRRAEIGLYLAGYRCVTIFWPLMVQFQASLLPRMVHWQTAGRRLDAQARRVAAVSLAPALAAAAALFLAAPWLVPRLFGPAYEPAVLYLRVLVWLLPLQVVRLTARQVLLARGQQKDDTWTTALGAATNVAVDLALIPLLGPLGCAVAALSANAVMAVANWTKATRNSAAIPPSGRSRA